MCMSMFCVGSNLHCVSEFTIHQVGDVRLQGVRGDILFVTDAHRSEGGPR